MLANFVIISRLRKTNREQPAVIIRVRENNNKKKKTSNRFCLPLLPSFISSFIILSPDWSHLVLPARRSAPPSSALLLTLPTSLLPPLLPSSSLPESLYFQPQLLLVNSTLPLPPRLSFNCCSRSLSGGACPSDWSGFNKFLFRSSPPFPLLSSALKTNLERELNHGPDSFRASG